MKLEGIPTQYQYVHSVFVQYNLLFLIYECLCIFIHLRLNNEQICTALFLAI